MNLGFIKIFLFNSILWCQSLVGCTFHIHIVTCQCHITGIHQVINSSNTDRLSVTHCTLGKTESVKLPLSNIPHHLESTSSSITISCTCDLPQFTKSFTAVRNNRLQLIQQNLTTQQIQTLNLSGTLPKSSNSNISQNLFLNIFFDKTMTTPSLNTSLRSKNTLLSQKTLQNWSQKSQTIIHSSFSLCVTSLLCLNHFISNLGTLVNHWSTTFSNSLLKQ